jgi:hypothetical protein
MMQHQTMISHHHHHHHCLITRCECFLLFARLAALFVNSNFSQSQAIEAAIDASEVTSAYVDSLKQRMSSQ